jgi:DNA-binding response OmpR family regulator
MIKILIVEDDPQLQRMYMRRFVADGYQVSLAENGQVGLEKAKLEHPDLILLDIMMPVMNGLEMLKLLRQDDWGKEADVILLTNSDDSKNINLGMGLKISYYWIKSNFDLEKLSQVVKQEIIIHQANNPI